MFMISHIHRTSVSIG